MSRSTKFLHPVSNFNEVGKIHENLSWVLRYTQNEARLVDITLFKKEGWTAVPVERYTHITCLDQKQLHQIFIKRGYTKLLAVALDPMGSHASVYALPVTIEAIEEFNRLWGAFNCTLFTGEPSWIIISTDSQFDVIAGPQDFIHQLLGCSADEAFSKFLTFITNHPMVEQQRTHLRSVYQLLQDQYSSAVEGSEFHLINPPTGS